MRDVPTGRRPIDLEKTVEGKNLANDIRRRSVTGRHHEATQLDLGENHDPGRTNATPLDASATIREPFLTRWSFREVALHFAKSLLERLQWHAKLDRRIFFVPFGSGV